VAFPSTILLSIQDNSNIVHVGHYGQLTVDKVGCLYTGEINQNNPNPGPRFKGGEKPKVDRAGLRTRCNPVRVFGSSDSAFTWSCEGRGQVPDLGELKQYKE
jgi:hypothetical protein